MKLRPPPRHFAGRETPVLTGGSAGMASLFDLYLASSQEHFLPARGKKPYVLQEAQPALQPWIFFFFFSGVGGSEKRVDTSPRRGVKIKNYFYLGI